MADEVKQLTGDERVDALCKILSEKHGIHMPAEVFMHEKEDKKAKK